MALFEKVNPNHPDKVADRIGGALVDKAYGIRPDAVMAAEVLIGHGKCHIISETNTHITQAEVEAIVHRIAGWNMEVDYQEHEQDGELAKNQRELHCGDNGIFAGVPTDGEEAELTIIARELYDRFKTDGKYIINGNDLIICQSNAEDEEIIKTIEKALPEPYKYNLVINPLGYWTGGTDVDTGAINRKLGSDMGRGLTGGGLHGKDLTKADVSINIYAHMLAHLYGHRIECVCSIGDTKFEVIDTEDGTKEWCDFKEACAVASKYIDNLGGFEKFAEWGLVR